MEKSKLQKELQEIGKLKKKVEKSLRYAPEGSIRCELVKGKYPQYYYMDEEIKKEHIHGKYLKKEELELARKLSQKEYDLKLLKMLDDQEKVIRYALSHYEEGDALSVYDQLPKPKKLLIHPYVLPAEEFLKAWYKEHPGSQNPYKIEDKHETERGEIVRSKTEKMIADKLFYRNIPYVYEPALVLKSNRIVYPDFLFLNLRTRKMIYHEHLGRMDDPNYCKKALDKLDEYERNGLFLGDNLTITMECSGKSINMQQIDSLIDRMLL